MEDKEKDVVKNSKPVKLKAKGRSVTGQPLDDININPQLDTKNKQQVQEQSRGGVVLTFGRMNPPTVGHEKLVKKVVAVAAQARATPMVFLSHSQDKKKNPLEYSDKIRFARAAFGNVVQASPAKTLIDILKTLQTKFEELTLVVGSDRIGEFETLLNKYNGKDFTFAKINVVSAGERDPDADGVEGMSASKMRAAVQTGDEQKFISGLPHSLKSQGRTVFKLVSAGMQLHEELEAEDLLSEVLTVDQRRKRGMIMRRYSAKIGRAKELARKRLAPTEKLKKRSLIQARDIIRRRVAGRRGAEYATLSPSEKIQIDIQVQKRKGIIKKIAGRLMPKVKAAEYARLKSFLQGTPLQQMHSGPNAQHEQFNEMFEEFAKTVEIVTVDDILQEMTDLVLEKIITEKQIQALEKRAQKSGVQFDLLEQVYVRGLLDTMGDQQTAFNRVNAFCCGGKSAMNEDFDLYQQIERKDLNNVFEAGLWDNIHAKRKRIKAGSGERMRKPGSEGAPTKQNFRDASESIEEGYDVNSKHYKALTDLDLNTKNRDMTTQNDGYGPLNPSDQKGSKSFWDAKAKMWKTTTEAAMEARCGNCAAFNQAPAIMKKMAEGLGPAGEKIQELSNLGFCELFEFKCAADRTCNKWLVGGPITEGMEAALKETATGSKLRMQIDAAPRTKLDRKKIAYVSRADDTRDKGEMSQQRQAHSKILGEEGNSQPNPRKRLMGTESLIKAYKKDTPGQDIDDAFNEAVKAADKEPVLVPAHYSATGKPIPAKTVMRKSSKIIVNKGDNMQDGK